VFLLLIRSVRAFPRPLPKLLVRSKAFTCLAANIPEGRRVLGVTVWLTTP
jgi:hypothetical protein